ncbi:LuxR C-terminal-related transcriptional regulator [Polaribacter sp. Z014]|uniref:LuxR C-terminal-related transcriptional regulator n=1 Tax=Polaribacter sp. Z014 TaxID=2927126 RepID=UPI0020200F72|nr:LuxR C-terminal-related transcriptional regulator [Polaribacter sp. Z014]MCL7763860.1 LuxR C-terminal-related transcriptional regulator [Polaribacter sp. Z014]
MKFTLLLLFFVGNIFSQSEVYYYKDSNNNFTYKNIDKEEFKLLKKQILEPNSKATYWFKVPASSTYLNYIFRINSIRANNVHAYQNLKEVKKLSNQRYVSFKFSRKYPIYIKTNSNFSSYYPVVLQKEEASLFREKLLLILNGFYYGAAFLVILFSISYFYFFKDIAFLYHAFLLICISFSFVVFDGSLNLFNVDAKNIELLILLDYILLSFSSLKFGNSFLMLDKNFPTVKKYTFFLFFNIVLFVILFYFLKINVLYTILSILTLLFLFLYWFLGVLLFKRNKHTKLFVFSYVFLLFSGFDFFVLKNLGISLFESNPTNLKIGGFVQIIVLSFGVLYREKDLRKYNFYMKNEIIRYSKELKKLIKPEEEVPLTESLENLSIREREIFDLIVSGKSNKEIAEEVNISVNTVKFHVKNIYLKLDIKNRKEALTIKKFTKT